MNTSDPIAVRSSLATSLTALFAGTSTKAPLRSGREVTFLPAKMRHLNKLIEVFETALNSVSQEEFEDLINLIVDQQAAAQASGKDATDIDVAEAVRVGKYNMTLVRKMFVACTTILPQIVPLFTDLSSDEYDDLEIDEGILVPVGIIAVNYPFFTQNLLPALSGLFSSMMRERARMQVTQNASSMQNARKD